MSFTAPSQRQRRVGEQLRHVISETLRRGHFDDPVLFEDARLVTVSEVLTTPDLKNARAYVMSLGGKNIEEILPALNESANYFQKEINRHLNLKFTPKVRFVVDKSFEQAQKIDKILQNIDYAEEDSEEE